MFIILWYSLLTPKLSRKLLSPQAQSIKVAQKPRTKKTNSKNIKKNLSTIKIQSTSSYMTWRDVTSLRARSKNSHFKTSTHNKRQNRKINLLSKTKTHCFTRTTLSNYSQSTNQRKSNKKISQKKNLTTQINLASQSVVFHPLNRISHLAYRNFHARMPTSKVEQQQSNLLV